MYPTIDMEDIEQLKDEVIFLRIVNNNLLMQNEDKDTKIKELEELLDYYRKDTV
jgi:hypothetical protein